MRWRKAVKVAQAERENPRWEIWARGGEEKQVPRSAYPICDGAPKRSARDDRVSVRL